MARRTDYLGQTKPIAAAAAQTLVWTNNELQGERVVAYHIGFSGAGNDLSDITRIRLSANGANIQNWTPEMLRAWLESYSLGAITLDANETRFTIPLYLADAPVPDMQDTCQFPVQSQVQLELQTGALTVAGSAVIAWTESNVVPETHPRMLGQVLNIPASVQNQRFFFQENGVVRGIWLPQTGLDRVRFVLAGIDLTHLPGVQFNATAFGNVALEAERLYGMGEVLTTSTFHRITRGVSAPAQGSYIELATGAGWAGAANETCIYAVAPNAPRVAA